ncbi:hypothetical protein [Breznakiella homolactica]|uniref:YD repeat-containing protein n=1 Tax=Breznakiella homolactica TaxID=2798577 RepID=A0A7T8B8Y0_9SPIR|nr:hypothetical protein [Breznakiella homolactica]QQO07370.1 hypothetical protein JFL75_10375 [Breznakiella homolactica]
MKPTFISAVLLLAIAIPGLSAQEPRLLSGNGAVPAENAAEGPEVLLFPLYPLIHSAEAGTVFWNPDWPLSMPPDAFDSAKKAVSGIILNTGDAVLACRWDGKGRLREFPVYLGGAFFQARTQRGGNDLLTEIFLTGPETITAELLEYRDGLPVLARITRGGGNYFVSFHHWLNGVSETWYDAQGNAAGLLSADYAKINRRSLAVMVQYIAGNEKSVISYSYDSWGNVSGITGAGIAVSALYNQFGRPRYVERHWDAVSPGDVPYFAGTVSGAAGNYSFQWDESGLLRTVRGAFDGNTAELRYEYTLDSERNWTERRELRMVRQGGYLFPQPGPVLTRTLEY